MGARSGAQGRRPWRSARLRAVSAGSGQLIVSTQIGLVHARFGPSMTTMRNHLTAGRSPQAHFFASAKSIVASVRPRPARLTADEAPVTIAIVLTGVHSTRTSLEVISMLWMRGPWLE